jgi:hypothetical protein
VQAVLAASALCVGNTEVLKRLAREADGDVGAALLMASSRLEGPQRGHLDWAHDTCQSMAVTLARSRVAEVVGGVAEKVVGKVKEALD